MKNVADIRKLREKTGLSLTESANAISKYGSFEEAIKHLGTPAQRDGFEAQQEAMRLHAELYRALRDSGKFLPDGAGWTLYDPNFAKPTAEELDESARRLMSVLHSSKAPQEEPREFKIDARANRSPAALDTDESRAWSIGVVHGVRETLACVTMILRERYPSLVTDLTQRISIKED